MKRLIITFSTCILDGCLGTKHLTDRSALIGVYASDRNAFEKWSILELCKNAEFIYTYGLGGCQDKILGTWEYRDGLVILGLNSEYFDVSYHVPNLDGSEWRITTRGIKPKRNIDNGCFIENSGHRRILN